MGSIWKTKSGHFQFLVAPHFGQGAPFFMYFDGASNVWALAFSTHWIETKLDLDKGPCHLQLRLT